MVRLRPRLSGLADGRGEKGQVNNTILYIFKVAIRVNLKVVTRTKLKLDIN